jgi:outer membrane protein
MQVRLVLALTLLATAPAAAQPAAPTPPAASFDDQLDALFVSGGLTADEAARRAVSVSPQVMRNSAEVEAAIAQAQAAELARVPQIGVSASYTRLSALDPLLLGPMGPAIEFPTDYYATQGQLAVPLSEYVLRFPKLIDAAKLGAEVARTSKKSSEVNAAQEARLVYYEWIRAKLQVLVADRQHAQVRAVLGQVRALAEVQRLSRADLMRVESQEAQAEQVANQLRQLASLREEQLRLLIGAGAEDRLAAGEDVRVDVEVPAGSGLDDLLGRATSRRLEFRVLDIGIAAKTRQREAERASRLPRLVAFATADYANPNQRVFPLQTEFRFTWQAGVQLSWTLNDALVWRTADHRLAAETDQLRADRAALLRGARIEILAAQQAVLLAQQALDTSRKGLAAAEESYRVRRELLAAERATAVELVDAETDLTRARISALNARVDLRIALAQLAHAVGDDAPR